MVDPARLVRDMHPRTLGLWRAMWEIDPQDANRQDWAAAQIAWATASAAGAKKLDGDDFEIRDFAPFVNAQMDPEELAHLEVERAEARLMAYLDRVSGHKATKYLE